MLDGAQGCSGNAQLDRAAKSLGHQRDVEQVREEPAAGTVEGVGNIVAHHHTLAGEFAATCHWEISCLCKGPAWRRRPRRASIVVKSGASLEKRGAAVKAKRPQRPASALHGP